MWKPDDGLSKIWTLSFTRLPKWELDNPWSGLRPRERHCTGNLLAMKNSHANYEVFNVRTGRPLTVLDVAHALSKALDTDIEPKIAGKFRHGDIRHCYADISKAQRVLGYTPRVAFEDCISDLVEWVSEQESLDLVDNATRELEMRGLTK